MNIFKKIFKTKETISSKKELATLEHIKQFDDVWVKINKQVYEGWVVEIVKDIIQVVYSDSNKKLQEINFKLERPFNKTSIDNTNKKLFLNKEEAVL